MEHHRRRLRLHFRCYFRRRYVNCMGRIADLRRVGTGRSAEIVGPAEGSHKDVGDEDSADRDGLLAHDDAGEHR